MFVLSIAICYSKMFRRIMACRERRRRRWRKNSIRAKNAFTGNCWIWTNWNASMQPDVDSDAIEIDFIVILFLYFGSIQSCKQQGASSRFCWQQRCYPWLRPCSISSCSKYPPSEKKFYCRCCQIVLACRIHAHLLNLSQRKTAFMFRCSERQLVFCMYACCARASSKHQINLLAPFTNYHTTDDYSHCKPLLY